VRDRPTHAAIPGPDPPSRDHFRVGVLRTGMADISAVHAALHLTVRGRRIGDLAFLLR
jgi:hypothetical protein